MGVVRLQCLVLQRKPQSISADAGCGALVTAVHQWIFGCGPGFCGVRLAFVVAKQITPQHEAHLLYHSCLETTDFVCL